MKKTALFCALLFCLGPLLPAAGWAQSAEQLTQPFEVQPLAEPAPSAEMADPTGLPDVLSESGLPAATPPPIPSDSAYHAEWAQRSVRILQASGLTLPPGVNYNVLMSQDEFLEILSQLSQMGMLALKSHRFSEPPLPAGRLSRGEAVHLLLASFGLTESLATFAEQESRFTDISRSHPAYASVVLAERLNLINGYPDRTIRPDEALSWGEALILAETVYSWRQALPTSAPEWVKAYEKRQNMWYQLMDGFRLLLTLAYLGLALFFLLRNWRRTRKRKDSPYRKFSLGLTLVTGLMGALWISELLFNYQLIPREAYALLAMLSVFVGLYLLKLSSDLDGDISKPKPQVVIDKGYIESINHERGELFIRDKVSGAHSLALVSPNSKVLRKSGRTAVESAFLSEIQTGDTVSLRGGRLEHESLVEVERLTLLESQQHQAQQADLQSYTQQKQSQTQQQAQSQYLQRRPPESR